MLNDFCPKSLPYNLILFFIIISGQNVDYFSLLKSFGSNPYDLAKVLGVNIDTLNNMDRDKRSKFLLEKLDLAPH